MWNGPFKPRLITKPALGLVSFYIQDTPSTLSQHRNIYSVVSYCFSLIVSCFPFLSLSQQGQCLFPHYIILFTLRIRTRMTQHPHSTNLLTQTLQSLSYLHDKVGSS